MSGKKLDIFGDRYAVFFTRTSLGLRKEGSSTFCNGEELFCCRLHEPIGEGVWNQFFSLSCRFRAEGKVDFSCSSGQVVTWEEQLAFFCALYQWP